MFDEEYPYQSAVIVGYKDIYDKYTLGAKAGENSIFLGWVDAITGEEISKEPMLDITVNGHREINAVFVPEEVTVYFWTGGGEEVPSQTVKYGEKIEEPESPTNGDMGFLGWFEDLENWIDKEKGVFNTFDFEQPITEDTYLTAVWTARFSFNINSGSGQIAFADMEEELEYSDDAPFQSVAGNSFVGAYDTYKVGAKADEGYEFVKWIDATTGETYSTEAEFEITIWEPTYLEVVFRPIGEESEAEPETKPETTPQPTDSGTPANTPTNTSTNTSQGTASNASKSTAPATGDENNIAFWFALMGAAAVTAVVAKKARRA